MTIIKKSFLIFLVFSRSVFLQGTSVVEDIQKIYKKPLVLVEALRLEHARNDYSAMVSLCLCFDKPLPLLIKQLRNDMQSVLRAIKKEGADLQDLHDKLKQLYVYLKKHKIMYKAILAHNDIKNLYQSLFDMIDNNQDVVASIDQNRELFGLEKSGDDFLNLFLKDVKKASRQISKFEDYIHSDYIDLKMQNYVFKIELIKLRNAILFDKRYKN